jgi:hypothetical protein
MKVGDLVHVPANVPLWSSDSIGSVTFFETKCPKIAIYLGDKQLTLDNKANFACIEYGRNTWMVSRKFITVVERKKNDNQIS